MVDDLAAAMAFFVELGLKLQGEGPVEGVKGDRDDGDPGRPRTARADEVSRPAGPGRRPKAEVAIRPVEDPDTFRDLLNAVVTGQRNHEDSKRKGASTSAGRRRAAERDEYVGALLDGYRIAVEVSPAGRVSKRMEIDPQRKPLFGLIFTLGLAGRLP